jgi:hypothetical protein
MPHRHDPDGGTLDTIEEPIRADDELPVRKLRELGQAPTQIRELLERSKSLLSAEAEAFRGRAILVCDVLDGREELAATALGEADVHLRRRERILSASARTLSSENPTPEAISFSPRANSRKIARSRSPRSKASTLRRTAWGRPRSVTTMGPFDPRTRRATPLGFSPSSANETLRALLAKRGLLRVEPEATADLSPNNRDRSATALRFEIDRFVATVN